MGAARQRGNRGGRDGARAQERARLDEIGPSVVGIALAPGSIFLLAHAVKSLPMATAYAVCTGIGAVGVAAAGIVFLGYSPHPLRLLCIGVVCAGIVGLHLLER